MPFAFLAFDLWFSFCFLILTDPPSKRSLQANFIKLIAVSVPFRQGISLFFQWICFFPQVLFFFVAFSFKSIKMNCRLLLYISLVSQENLWIIAIICRKKTSKIKWKMRKRDGKKVERAQKRAIGSWRFKWR